MLKSDSSNERRRSKSRAVHLAEVSAKRGDLIRLDGRPYVTASGLLRVANSRRCAGIHVRPVLQLCDPEHNRWVFEAVVYKTKTCKGFSAYADATPENVSEIVRGAELRVAETRAVNRALRKAYGIGLCSVEELGPIQPDPPPPPACVRLVPKAQKNGDGDSPSVRDQLRFLIRQHELDPGQVKAYAADFCGAPELKKVTREKLIEFVRHLENYATHDRDSLIEQLQSYASASGKEGAA